MSGKYNIIGVGVQAVSKDIYKAGVVANETGKREPRQSSLYSSKLGTPVFSDLTIDPFNYTVDGVTYFVPGLKIYAMIMTINKNKNIVKTSIQGLDTTVKEYISSADDSVIIEGEISAQNGNYPYNEVNELNKLIEAPVAFKVTSKYLQNLDIDTLVIEGAEIPQEEGGTSYQKFKLYCITDLPVELNIISSSNTTAQ